MDGFGHLRGLADTVQRDLVPHLLEARQELRFPRRVDMRRTLRSPRERVKPAKPSAAALRSRRNRRPAVSEQRV
jgi:hypothetical protein